MRALVFVVLSGCSIVIPPIAQQYNDACAQFIAGNDLAQADAACDHALEYQPKFWDALHNKGVIAQQRGDTATAKKFFIEAVRANSAMRQSYNSLGIIEQQAGDRKTAAEYFRQALVQHPEYVEARRNLGVLLLLDGKPAEAEGQFRQLVMVAPTLVEAHLGLATSLVAQGKNDEGAKAAERATDLNVGDAAAWFLRGQIDEARGLTEDAKDAYERCLLANDQKLECQQALKRLTSD